MQRGKTAVLISLFGFLPVLGVSVEPTQVQPSQTTVATPQAKTVSKVKGSAKPKAKPKPKATDKVAAKPYWTCPHEGGHFDHAGKCPNTWCGMDLVQVDPAHPHDHQHEGGQ